MDELYEQYRRILQSGLLILRDAAYSGDVEWCRAEAEHLHEIPSLIGETNVHRHLWYIASARTRYLEWVLAVARPEVKARVGRVYLPYWKRIEEIVEAMTPAC